jgi:hypothetical protein
MVEKGIDAIAGEKFPALNVTHAANFWPTEGGCC